MRNFKMQKETDDFLFASVDVRCGFLWLKHETVTIFRHRHGVHWKYRDTGKFTPLYIAESMEEAHAAREQLAS